ncbi:hypothetical protein TNCV_1627491, partial [Trichonephila clavipes]
TGAQGGRGSLVVKVMDSWAACHEFKPNTAEDSPCRGAMHVKFVESSNVLPLVWELGEGVPVHRCRLRHFTVVQNDEDSRLTQGVMAYLGNILSISNPFPSCFMGFDKEREANRVVVTFGFQELPIKVDNLVEIGIVSRALTIDAQDDSAFYWREYGS